MYVSRLFVHPVKSLGGVSVESYIVDRFGPQWDRRWMVVDEQGKFITQRQLAAMALIKAKMVQDNVQLTTASGEALEFSAADFNAGEDVAVQVWRDQCVAKLGPAHVHAWLSRVLGRPCRLVFMHDACKRSVDESYSGPGHTVSFADGFPLLLTQQASLDVLNGYMSINIGMERFRPNLVVEGGPAWEEDQWRKLRIGSMLFDVVKPCSRCAIPTIDPGDASKQPEVFKTLKQYRSQAGEVYFGQNLVARGGGQLFVGDQVEVLE